MFKKIRNVSSTYWRGPLHRRDHDRFASRYNIRSWTEDRKSIRHGTKWVSSSFTPWTLKRGGSKVENHDSCMTWHGYSLKTMWRIVNGFTSALRSPLFVSSRRPFVFVMSWSCLAYLNMWIWIRFWNSFTFILMLGVTHLSSLIVALKN